MDNIINITASGQPPEPPKNRSEIEQLEYLTGLLNDLSFGGSQPDIRRGGTAPPHHHQQNHLSLSSLSPLLSLRASTNTL